MPKGMKRFVDFSERRIKALEKENAELREKVALLTPSPAYLAKRAEATGDLLVCAFEGGSNYWYRIEDFLCPDGKTRDDYRHPHMEVPLKGGAIVIHADGHKNPADKNGLWTLDAQAIERGWKLMLESHPRHFGDAMDGGGDATTGDVFLQLCLFGDVIFG